MGKSTLLGILSGLDEPDSGRVHLGLEKIGYVFQEDRLLPWMTLFENVKLANVEGKDEDVLRAIKSVGLKNFVNHYPRELSGGMKQRGSIARAMYYGGDLLFLDEAFKSLDEQLRMELLELVVRLRDERHISCLFVTHDIEEALIVSDRILILRGRPATIVSEISLKDLKGEGKLSLETETRIRREILKALYQ